jgi:hypothetical protein
MSALLALREWLSAPRRWRVAGGSTLIVGALSAAAGGQAPCATGLPPYANPYAAAAPYAGQPNHAHVAPPFQWGSFGAEHHYPRVNWHRDYNGELMRWAVLRRY